MQYKYCVTAEFNSDFRYDEFVEELKYKFPDFFKEYLTWSRCSEYTAIVSTLEQAKQVGTFFEKYGLKKTDATFEHPGCYHCQTSSKYDESDFESAELFSINSSDFYQGDDK